MEDILKWRIQDRKLPVSFLAISLLLLLKIVYVLANFLDFIRDLTFLMSTLMEIWILPINSTIWRQSNVNLRPHQIIRILSKLFILGFFFFDFFSELSFRFHRLFNFPWIYHFHWKYHHETYPIQLFIALFQLRIVGKFNQGVGHDSSLWKESL